MGRGGVTNDSYGTSHREAMKQSMERPAGEWNPSNRSSFSLFAWAFGIFVGTVLAFDLVFSWYMVARSLWVRLGR